MNDVSEQEEHSLVYTACGCLMAIPTSQLSDYYRGQRWFAGLGFALMLVQLAFLLT